LNNYFSETGKLMEGTWEGRLSCFYMRVLV